jgi:maleylacetoacetate isomerase
MFELYTFSRSSASYRVRIALALKGVSWVAKDISLAANEHESTEFLAINPQGRVPALATDQGLLTQSLAIIDWLEETHPQSPSVYPSDAWQRAQCRAFAYVIASDIFPLQNLSTRRKIHSAFRADEAAQAQWCREWIVKGFQALEREADARQWHPEQGYLFGDGPSLAEICLVPQMDNARRYEVDLSDFPLLLAADSYARLHPAFISAQA